MTSLQFFIRKKGSTNLTGIIIGEKNGQISIVSNSARTSPDEHHADNRQAPRKKDKSSAPQSSRAVRGGADRVKLESTHVAEKVKQVVAEHA